MFNKQNRNKNLCNATEKSTSKCGVHYNFSDGNYHILILKQEKCRTKVNEMKKYKHFETKEILSEVCPIQRGLLLLVSMEI
jgi:hypothetical protein